MRTLAMLLSAFSVSVVFAIPQDTTRSDVATYDDAEAYRVYSTILPEEFPWRQANVKTLVIRRETAPHAMCIEPNKESKKIVGAAIADYKKKNEKKWLLGKQFDIAKPYEMISGDEIDTVFKTGWTTFYQRHPGSDGWIELSAVGFNTSKTVAVVYTGQFCGSLCSGGGSFHILQKVSGKWIPFLKGGDLCLGVP